MFISPPKANPIWYSPFLSRVKEADSQGVRQFCLFHWLCKKGAESPLLYL